MVIWRFPFASTIGTPPIGKLMCDMDIGSEAFKVN
jgi:hypothetical protein